MGLRGRVNGPVDNPLSSCLSCHSRALDSLPIGKTLDDLFAQPSLLEAPGFTPPNSGLGLSQPCTINATAAATGETEVAKWFRNLGTAQAFFPNHEPLDYSLQLAEGVANFYAWALEFKATWNSTRPPIPTPSSAPAAESAPAPDTVPAMFSRARRHLYTFRGFNHVPRSVAATRRRRPRQGWRRRAERQRPPELSPSRARWRRR